MGGGEEKRISSWCLMRSSPWKRELAWQRLTSDDLSLNLHRYHHVSVLYFTWAAHEAAHPGMYFIAMNYTVHSVMYTYYFLMAIKAKPKWLKYVKGGRFLRESVVWPGFLL